MKAEVDNINIHYSKYDKNCILYLINEINIHKEDLLFLFKHDNKKPLDIYLNQMINIEKNIYDMIVNKENAKSEYDGLNDKIILYSISNKKSKENEDSLKDIAYLVVHIYNKPDNLYDFFDDEKKKLSSFKVYKYMYKYLDKEMEYHRLLIIDNVYVYTKDNKKERVLKR